MARDAAAGDPRSGDRVFLHGDLMCVNILPASEGAPVTLLDWSDATLGPADHEFISPLMHQFRGDPEDLEYATLLGRSVAHLPGAPPRSWEDAAHRFCRIPR